MCPRDNSQSAVFNSQTNFSDLGMGEDVKHSPSLLFFSLLYLVNRLLKFEV